MSTFNSIITTSPFVIYQAGFLAALISGNPMYAVFSLFAIVLGNGSNYLLKLIFQEFMSSELGKRPSSCGTKSGKNCIGCGIFPSSTKPSSQPPARQPPPPPARQQPPPPARQPGTYAQLPEPPRFGLLGQAPKNPFGQEQAPPQRQAQAQQQTQRGRKPITQRSIPTWGMPSGHTQVAAFAATFWTIYIALRVKNEKDPDKKKERWVQTSIGIPIIWGLVIIVCVQRVVVKCNTILQVSAGAIFGALLGLISYAICAKIFPDIPQF